MTPGASRPPMKSTSPLTLGTFSLFSLIFFRDACLTLRPHEWKMGDNVREVSSQTGTLLSCHLVPSKRHLKDGGQVTSCC